MKVDPYRTASQEDLVRDHLPLVKRIAYRLMAKLPPSVEVDDLIQVGLMGLLDAAQHFDEEQKAPFEIYASQRIRGAMLDELRQMDWWPRSARKLMREIEAAMQELQQSLKRTPLEREVADLLGVSLGDYQQKLQEAAGHQLLYYEDFFNGDEAGFLDRHVFSDAINPLVVLEDDGFRQKLLEAIRLLPEREQLLMSLYYEEDLNLREIGLILEVTESRVCQLHTQAIGRIRSMLRDWIK
ncbi:MAG: RNA polymerase sigma factor FliA [Pseudomonadota bacterium]|nr:RNA polymerase sigma factor FliA [Pseudomonadota bacterium]